jgi:iduronate 2-sulfatase
LICVDDLKPALGCYGDPLAKTSNIDRLAARGTLFEKAYCNQAVCSPSRNALLVGLRSQTIGIYDLATNFRRAVPDATTLPQHFKEHGYRTEALGKIFHVGHGNQDDAVSWSVPHWRSGANNYALEESRPQGNAKANNAAKAKGVPYENADVADNAYPDGSVADEAIKRLAAAAEREEPFFLAVGFVKPHLPFCAPKKYWDAFDPAVFNPAERQTPPAGAPAYAPTPGGELRNYRDVPKQGTLPEDLQRTLIHGYYAAASYTDAQIGRVVDELDRLGLASSTLIVLWGDHGWHLGDHGQWCKHTNYEQAAHIPLIIAAPQQAAKGQRVQGVVESVDIYPTLAQLAGLPTPSTQTLDGMSLASVIQNPVAPTKAAVYHSFPRNASGRNLIGRAVRTDRYRLVEWKEAGGDPATAEFELYDYESDPAETRNLAADRPEVVSELQLILAKLPEAKPQLITQQKARGKGKLKGKK